MSSSKGKGKAEVTYSDTVSEHSEHSEGSHSHEHEEPAWPVVTAEEISDAMEDQHHFMDSNLVRNTACISDMAGMEETGMGVHRVRLAPGRESTVLHAHLANSEWIYILSGQVTLVLARTRSDPDDVRPGPEAEVVLEETQLKAGDFAGFPAGHASKRWAHALRAGNEGVEYLLGGDRKPLDVITYPTRGQTLVWHDESGAETLIDGRSK